MKDPGCKKKTKITTLKKNSSETVTDYLTRADKIQYNFKQVDFYYLENASKKLRTFSTKVKISKDEF